MVKYLDEITKDVCDVQNIMKMLKMYTVKILMSKYTVISLAVYLCGNVKLNC